jgi:hypothetical protein
MQLPRSNRHGHKRLYTEKYDGLHVIVLRPYTNSAFVDLGTDRWRLLQFNGFTRSIFSRCKFTKIQTFSIQWMVYVSSIWFLFWFIECKLNNGNTNCMLWRICWIYSESEGEVVITWYSFWMMSLFIWNSS